jgi:hypothetical protein
MQGPSATDILAAYQEVDAAIKNYEKVRYMKAVARLGLADRLVSGPRTATDLAVELTLDAPTLTRFLRACCAVGLLTETGPEIFAATATGTMLRSTNPLHGVLLGFTSGLQDRVFEQVEVTLRTGKAAAPAALGAQFYQAINADPAEEDAFGRWMTYSSRRAGKRIAAEYDLSPFHRVVDVGGGTGVFVSQLLTAAPHLTGVVFDHADVVARGERYTRIPALAGRLDLVAGSFLDSIPSDGDLYTIKMTLLDWTDGPAGQILANIAKAMPVGATLLVIDALRPAGPAVAGDDFADRMWLMDFWELLMLGGKVRSEAEFRTMLEEAGFTVGRVLRVADTPYPWDVIEAIRT